MVSPTNPSPFSMNIPINVLPSSALIRASNRQDTNYSAHDFLTIYEDVMKESNVDTDIILLRKNSLYGLFVT